MKTWKTKDGKILELSEMTYSHLENAIAFMKLKRAAFQFPFGEPDFSLGLAEAIFRDEEERIEDVIESLQEELNSRSPVPLNQ